MVSLREARAERLLSIRDLAQRASVAPTTIYRTEAGLTTPRPSVARRLAEVLGVEPQEIEEFRRLIEASKAPVRRNGERAVR
jgi:transcriptional regulator with XRE-family HTH domain